MININNIIIIMKKLDSITVDKIFVYTLNFPN